MQTKQSTKSAKPNKRTEGNFRFADFFIVVFFLLLAAAGIALFRQDLLQTFNVQNKEPVGTVIVKENIVQRRLGDRVLWDRLSKESPVYLGDLIRVAEISSASLGIENSNIDLDENTLVRITRSPDGEGFKIELSSGKIALSSGETGKSISLELNGRTIQTDPGTVLNAAAGDNGMSVQVSSGAVQISENGNSRKISSGERIAMNSEGTELLEKAAVVTRPIPNARYLKSAHEPVPVNFEWNRINFLPRETLRLEIAKDRSFNQIFRVINGLDRQARVSLETGLWHWRLSFENTVLSDGRITVADGAGLQLISPALNSLFRYRDELPVLNFQWTEAEDASSYILEVSNSSDFASLQVRSQTTTVNHNDSSLGTGTWYWRVMPVFPDIFTGRPSFSQPAFFRIEKITAEQAAAEQVAMEKSSVEEWLAMVTPSKEALPPDIPPELVPSEWKPEPKPEPVVEPKPALKPEPKPEPKTELKPALQPEPRPAPRPERTAPTLLPPPENIQPAVRERYGLAELMSLKNIVFEWKTVQGANAYIFTLFQQTEDGRRQVISAAPSESTSYVLDNLKLLDNGVFIWQIEAIIMGRNGVVERRGRVGEYTFVLDFPPPEPVQIQDAGILYGN
jgi:hypothetical protein